jgi:hypothetical protein
LSSSPSSAAALAATTSSAVPSLAPPAALIRVLIHPQPHAIHETLRLRAFDHEMVRHCVRVPAARKARFVDSTLLLE